MISGSVYQEVYELLCGLDTADLYKIPLNILNEIALKRDKNFKTNIDKCDLYNTKNISEEALKFYMNLDYKYLMTEEEKNYIDETNC